MTLFQSSLNLYMFQIIESIWDQAPREKNEKIPTLGPMMNFLIRFGISVKVSVQFMNRSMFTVSATVAVG